MRPRGSYDLPEVAEIFGVLKAIRESRGMSQKALAEALDGSQAWICDLETGRHPDPQMSTLIRVSSGLQIRARMIFEDERTGNTWTVPFAIRGLVNHHV